MGIFDPGVAGMGTHTLFYDSPEGCTASTEITVTPFEEAVINGLDDSYCFRDTVVDLQAEPAGGTLSIDGQVVSQFNPIDIGLGEHTVRYSIGTGNCFDEEVRTIEIGVPLSISLPFAEDSICYGFNIELNAEGAGGEPQNGYTFHWNQGLGFGRNHLVNPTTTTTYTVVLEDGCSEPAEASITVVVHPEIEVAYTTDLKYAIMILPRRTSTAQLKVILALLGIVPPPILAIAL